MGNEPDKDRLDRMRKLIGTEYYDRVLNAWFKAYKRAGGKPDRIMKKYMMEEGGLVYHQRFDHYFSSLEDIYQLTRLRFHIEMKNVVYCYNHQNALGARLWEEYLRAVLTCWKESRIALRRDDIRFFLGSLLEIRAYLEQDLFELDADNRAYGHCFAALLGLVMKTIKDWDAENYDHSLLVLHAHELALLSYSLNHPSSGFARTLQRV